MVFTNQIDWEKVAGLIPAIIQDYKSGEVLMMAYMNREALRLSLNTKLAHYYSRTKDRIWMKGETSGHTQKIIEMLLDCDGDTILLKVEQTGVACHTGRESCFFTSLESGDEVIPIKSDLTHKYSVIDQLYHTILEKGRENDILKSYTAKLLAGGSNKILKKVIEEAGEFSLAVKDNSKNEIIYECADLVYHSLVALAHSKIDPDLIRRELVRRFDIGGLVEKASRNE
jgi:phosphoribosyl-ATP pyrophosphohydrolase/phosphoribosyl-AMP cyclohydrolase